MKLNNTKFRYILCQNRKHISTKDIAREIKVFQRRVQLIIKKYKEMRLEAVFGEKVGRPPNPHGNCESLI
jgi:putative transposase